MSSRRQIVIEREIIDTSALLDFYLENIEICELELLTTGRYLHCEILLGEEGGKLIYYFAEEDCDNYREDS